MKLALVVLLAIFFVPSSFAYDVVLKNGKIISGRLITQTEEALILIGPSGAAMNIHKSEVDIEETMEANPNEKLKLRPPPPIEDAAEEDLKGAEKTRDIEDTAKKATVKPQNEIAGQSKSDKGATNKKSNNEEPEKDWIEETTDLAEPYFKSVAGLRYLQANELSPCVDELLNSGVIVFSASGEVIDYLLSTTVEDIPPHCYNLLEAEEEINELKEEARREGVPLQWMDDW